NHIIAILAPSAVDFIPKTRAPKPRPTRRMAIPNFTTTFGSYLPSFTQTEATTGAKMMINKAFKLRNQGPGISQPKKSRLVTRSAYKFKEVYACSNSAQKTTERRINIVNAYSL